MSISLEALAMSGANYLDYGLDVEELEQMESEFPLHLLADDKDDDDWEWNKIDLEYIIPYLLWEFENQSRSISKWHLNDDDVIGDGYGSECDCKCRNDYCHSVTFLKQKRISRLEVRGRDNHVLHRIYDCLLAKTSNKMKSSIYFTDFKIAFLKCMMA
ncbi:hypothetical protein Fot_25463 [Forsythia ovata]|uniref:Uncharacterized protein n=1 Tax=Forsythia ovata TaxID=205694 RepID=A0ABD1UAF5_9LAMI